MKSKRPNILIITTHDTGRTLGCYGIEQVRTPFCDSLAADGVRMSNYFATAPISCASRASMMTGRYPQSHGLMDLCFPPFDWAMHENEQHLSQILRDSGYATHLFGIQHEAEDPTRLGFDELHDRRRLGADGVAAEVAEFLAGRVDNNQPFYAQVGFFETHAPFTWGGVEPDETNGVYVPPYLVESDLIRRMAAEFQGSIRKMDAAVGAIMAALEKCGLAEETIFVLTTDHGIEFPRAKWTLYDPGLECLMILRWPAGNVSGGRVSERLQSNVDLLPTILELAGLPIPEQVQGISFAGALTGGNEPPEREAIFALYAKRTQARCIRTRNFKMIRNFDIDRYFSKPVNVLRFDEYGVTPRIELYDLHVDPLEFHNVEADPSYAEVKSLLGKHLLSWLQTVEDPILNGPLRTPFFEKSLKELHGE